MNTLNRIYSLLVAGVFIFSLLLPLLIYVFSSDMTLSVAEKRKLKPFPEFSWEYESLLEFPKEFDAYYQDHFGLRDALIIFHNSIRLDIFGISPSPMVMKGTDDWYYYIGAGEIAADYYGMKQVDVNQLDEYNQVLNDRRDWLASMGIRYLFVPVPNKINVYAENLPGRIQKMSGMTFNEQFSKYLNSVGNESLFVDVGALLTQNKKRHQVYFRTDTHWNHRGALDTFNQIIRQLQDWFPELKEIVENEIVRKEVTHTGDLLYTMHMENQIAEVVNTIELKSVCSASIYRKKLPDILYKALPWYADEKDLPFEGGCRDKGLTALVINDSFGAYLRPFFDARFKRVIYSKKYDFNNLQALISTLRPDVVIDERVSRNLNKALVHDSGLETKVVQMQFEQSDELVFDLSNVKEPGPIFGQHDVQLRRRNNAYVLTALSDDPHITVAPVNLKKGRRYNVMIELTTPEETVLEIFYKPIGSIIYQARNSIIRKISKGYNKLYFHFPNLEVESQVRIDPGKLPVVSGQELPEYVLHSLAIKAWK